MDVDVQAIDDSQPTREDKRQDVDIFFDIAVVKNVNGSRKSIMPVNYAHEFLFAYSLIDVVVVMGLLGTIKVLLMKLQPYDAILRRMIQ